MGSDYWLKARGERILPEERSLLYAMAEYVSETFERDLAIVNVGVSWGASVHCLCAGAPSAIIIAIDENLKARPFQGIDQLNGRVKFIEADSAMYNYCLVKEIHLAFVDGGHNYETVKADIANLVQYIPLGGIIAFHDYRAAPRDIERLAGVRRAVNEWQDDVYGDWTLRWSAGSIAAYMRVK